MSLIFGQEAESVNQYRVDDTTESTLADNDNVPFYDTSAMAKRKTSWSNIKSKLKSYFDSYYSQVRTRGSATSGGTTLSLVNTGDMYTWNNKQNSITAGDGLDKIGDTLSIKELDSTDIEELKALIPSTAPKYHVYSTEEQVVGQWVDGSTIFERTYIGTLPSTIPLTSPTTITLDTGYSSKQLISSQGTANWFQNNVNGWCDLMTCEWLGDSGTYVTKANIVIAGCISISADELILRFAVGYNATIFQSKPYRITVQYTKTT